MESESDSEVEYRADGLNTILKVDEWLVFRLDEQAAQLVFQLRQKWQSLFLRRMRAPTEPYSKVKIIYMYVCVCVCVCV